MRQSHVYWIIEQFYKLTLLILELSVFLSSLSADNNATLSDFPTMPYLLSVSCKTTILVIPTVAKNAMNRLKLEFIISVSSSKSFRTPLLGVGISIFQSKSFEQLTFSYVDYECLWFCHSFTHNIDNDFWILKACLKQQLDQ